jgi:hypothetical protein
MNPWQVPGDILPGLGRILERYTAASGRIVPLSSSRDSSEHIC